MNRLLKFTQKPGKNVFFTSDTHWNHNPVRWPVPLWKSRGYSSVEESNAHIIESINETVGENDILFHCGDITLNCNEEQFESFIGALKCRNIYTIWGNHNSPAWKVYQREVENCLGRLDLADVEVYPFRYKNLVFIGNYAEVVVDGIYFVLGHYPIYVFNNMKDGAYHLCGHSHYNFPFSRAENLTSRILDVGWDGWLKPLSVKEISDIMATKSVLAVDHHKKDEL